MSKVSIIQHIVVWGIYFTLLQEMIIVHHKTKTWGTFSESIKAKSFGSIIVYWLVGWLTRKYASSFFQTFTMTSAQQPHLIFILDTRTNLNHVLLCGSVGLWLYDCQCNWCLRLVGNTLPLDWTAETKLQELISGCLTCSQFFFLNRQRRNRWQRKGEFGLWIKIVIVDA